MAINVATEQEEFKALSVLGNIAIQDLSTVSLSTTELSLDPVEIKDIQRILSSLVPFMATEDVVPAAELETLLHQDLVVLHNTVPDETFLPTTLSLEEDLDPTILCTPVDQLP